MKHGSCIAALIFLSACAATQPGYPTRVTDAVNGTVESVSSILVPAPEGAPPFYMTRTEITWDLFEIFVYRLDLNESEDAEVDAEARPSRPYYLPDKGFERKGHPALAMTHKNAMAFAAWLSSKSGQTYRLPTEAEWEHACAAGNSEPPDPITDYAWHWDNANDKTGPVAALKANAYGLHDMLGNVSEFVIAADGVAVVKGGSYKTDADDLTCQWRSGYKPAWNAIDPQFPKSRWWYANGSYLGFRLLREVPAD